jgi:hypothetical protein
VHSNPRPNLRVRMIISIAALTLACGAESTPPALERFRSLTVPPGGKAFPPLTRTIGESVETSWIVQTEWAWLKYQKWIQHSLSTEFTTIAVTENEIVCKDSRQGDRHRLRLQPSGESDATSVRVTVATSKQ